MRLSYFAGNAAHPPPAEAFWINLPERNAPNQTGTNRSVPRVQHSRAGTRCQTSPGVNS
jgi:hypothetical protein